MLRQRVRARSSRVAHVLVDALVVVVALALMWGGAMLVALAFKAPPHTIDSLSGYRTAYRWLAALEPADITSSTRLVTAVAGAAAAVLFGWLAWRALPRPYLARTELRLAADERGSVDVSPRVIERAVEQAALEHAAVTTARARYGTDDLTLDVATGRADALGETLQDVQRRARDSLARHDLPPLPVNVTFVRLDRKHRRELQ
jgi:TRAP-type C4-dicarboxylate transport system permease small subunit